MDLPPPPSPGPLPFQDASASLAGLDPTAMARLLAAGGDVTLVIDAGGVIRDVAVGSNELEERPFADWVDRPFEEVVTEESRPKVSDMLLDVSSRAAPRWRQVNHPGGDGAIPIRYLALEAGFDGKVLAIGRDMRPAAALQQKLVQAQQAMEREHARQRQAEQRYRLLFNLCPDPVLIVDATSRRIIEANPAAAILVARPGEQVQGRTLPALFAPGQRDHLVQRMQAAAGGSAQAQAPAELADGRKVDLAFTLFRQERSAFLLVQLFLEGRARSADSIAALAPDVVELIPDGFVLVDQTMRILAANANFLDLLHVPHAEQLAGQSIEELLDRPEIDMDIIRGHLKSAGYLRNLQTVLRNPHGIREPVVLSAVSSGDGGEPVYGLTFRAAASLGANGAGGVATARPAEQLADLVGRMPLKEIVRESTDMIERLCIEAALRYTSNNRASAAEILGLSRQSLYSKLHRHGIAGSGPDAAADD